jgi:hypothetical protein
LVLDIQWIRKQIESEDYEFSEHAEEERQAEQLSIMDIEEAILNGEVLENYPNDPRGPSCLVLGYRRKRQPAHIVCGKTSLAKLRLITVYIPSLPKWIDERTRRQ